MGFLNTKPRAAASATPSAPAARQRGRYQQLRSTGDQSPRLVKGDYVLEIKESKTFEAFEKGRMWKIDFTVLEAAPGSGNTPGSPASILKGRANGKQESVLFPMLKRICIVTTGHNNDREFEEAFPDWEDLFDRALGEKLDENKFGENPLAGGKIRACVTDGRKRDEQGNPYPEYTFSPYVEPMTESEAAAG